MENKKISHVAKEDINIKNAIKDIEKYLSNTEDNEVSEEYKIKFNEMETRRNKDNKT